MWRIATLIAAGFVAFAYSGPLAWGVGLLLIVVSLTEESYW